MGSKSAEFNLERLRRGTALGPRPQDFVYRHLTNLTNGTIDMNVNGSVAAVNFDYVVPLGTIYQSFIFSRLNVEIVDNAIRMDRFAGLAAALPNGLLFQVLDDGGNILQHFDTDRMPIQTNADFTVLAGVDAMFEPTAGPDLMPVRFSIFKAGFRMIMMPGETVRVIVQDDISAVAVFRIEIQGILREFGVRPD